MAIVGCLSVEDRSIFQLWLLLDVSQMKTGSVPAVAIVGCFSDEDRAMF